MGADRLAIAKGMAAGDEFVPQAGLVATVGPGMTAAAESSLQWPAGTGGFYRRRAGPLLRGEHAGSVESVVDAVVRDDEVLDALEDFLNYELGAAVAFVHDCLFPSGRVVDIA